MGRETTRARAVGGVAAHAAELERLWGTPVGGPRWDGIEPACEFGWRMALDPGLAGHTWPEVEADLAGHWYRPQAASEEMAWDQVRDAVRLAWDLARARAAAAALGADR